MHTLPVVHINTPVTHMQITWYVFILFLSPQFQRSTIGYLSNSWVSCADKSRFSNRCLVMKWGLPAAVVVRFISVLRHPPPWWRRWWWQ